MEWHSILFYFKLNLNTFLMELDSESVRNLSILVLKLLSKILFRAYSVLEKKIKKKFFCDIIV